jgi:hypothetical protein
MREESKIYQRAIQKMSANKETADNGGVNCIPTSLSRFSKFWPGVEKGKYYMVTASSGVGKSKYAKKTFVFDVVDTILAHPEWNIDIHIKYYCLEESKVNFIQTLMSYKLYEQNRVRVSVPQMNSVGETVEQSVIDNAIEWEEYWKKFEEIVEVIDDIRHPTGIFKHAEDWLLQHGHWVMIDREFTNNETGVKYKKSVKDYYVPNHPDRYVIVAVDHFSLLQTEKGAETLHQAMTRLSSVYFLNLRDKYNCAVVNVQQQAADTEKQQFNYKGQSVEAKLEPTMAGLGDNKLTQRDVDVAFGLFAPDRYEIPKHLGYDVKSLQDHYRSLKILKYRDGISNVRVGLFFDGAVGNFEELDPSMDMQDADYEIYMGRVGLLKP